MFLFRLVYNTLFAPVFLFFLPAMLWKVWRRPGYKKTYAERFGIFDAEQKKRLNAMGTPRTWIHAVSVGETQLALSMIKRWLEINPNQHIVLSTTTTTGQDIARKGAIPQVTVIFMPLDFYVFIRRAFQLILPTRLVIFETEIWPELIYQARNRGVKILLANGRMSDKSSRGYRRFAWIFAPMLKCMNALCVQSDADAQRYQNVCGTLRPIVTGNMKFDQRPPEAKGEMLTREKLWSDTAEKVIMAASTHPGEEAFILRVFERLKKEFPTLKLLLVPRHAERGNEIESLLQKTQMRYVRRSVKADTPTTPIDVLLADTTGEMLKLMPLTDMVIMGKSLAGQNEGHNLIEPALLAKPILTGRVLKNFRYVLTALQAENAVITVDTEDELYNKTLELLNHPERGVELGKRAQNVIARNEGATTRTLEELEKLV